MLKTMLGRYRLDVGARYLKTWHLSKFPGTAEFLIGEFVMTSYFIAH
jgi:hypothetical protein